MVRPDALPVRPLASRAVLPPPAVAALFGAGATLRPSARVDLVRLGAVVGTVAVEAGPALALRLDALDAEAGGDGLRLQGPVGAVAAPTPTPVTPRLVLPDGLRRAWGIPDETTFALGSLALAVTVASGPEAAVEVDRALWIVAGRPDVARWLPTVDLAPPEAPPEAGPRVETVDRRVITETDVRQARLRRTRIRVGPGQIVTPAALSLGHELGVFEA